MRLSKLYIIKNKINGKVYIGQTVYTIEQRWQGHLKRYRNSKFTYKLHNAMRKYGVENFYYEMLEEKVLPEEVNEKERLYIEKYNSFENGYNSTKGGDGRLFGSIEEEEIVTLYLAGLSAAEIGILFEVSWTTILRILSKHEIEVRSKHGISDKEEFKVMYLNGVPLKEIAEYFNVNLKTVSRTRNRLELDKRLDNQRREDVETIRKE